MRRHLLCRLVAIAVSAAALGCRKDPAGLEAARARAYNPDWTLASHGDVAPNYQTVFPQSAVNTIEITMTAAQWADVRADVKRILGVDFGEGGIDGPGPGPSPGPGPGPGGGPAPGPGGDDEDPDLSLPDPSYVEATLRFNGKQWKSVGFRLKGNSSLANAWFRGIYKLPFRLNLDEYEASQPAVTDQRFYGFKELSFSPGTSDNSLIREKLAADLFHLAGVPAARTAFYRVYIDFGEGLKYCGVYTAVEVIDDTMVQNQFGGDRGNIYKPESRLKTFDQTRFEKKNNRAGADWSDVKAFVAALNSPQRTTDPAAWRASLEATFDVDHFLRWLAINNAIVNWDSYGAIAHNYYLYNHPTRKLVWIPWDHDLSMIGNPGITGTPGGGGGPAPIDPPEPGGPLPGEPIEIGAVGLSLSMNEVSDAWPLLRYLADDGVYFARYKAHLKTFRDAVFTEARVDPMIDRYTALITPYVVGSEGEQPGYTHLRSEAAFTEAAGKLKAHVRDRRALIAQFVP